MSTILKIPMNEENRIALEDCFIDIPNTDARKFIFDNVKMACQDAKRSLRNKVTPVNQRQENGQMKQEEYSLKGIDFEKYSLDSNALWVPKGLDAEDNSPIELKLGDNTMGYIRNYCQLVLIRHEQYNMAEEKYLEATKQKMIDSNAPEDTLKQWEEAQESVRKQRLEAVPKCIEEAIFVSIWTIIQQKIDQSDSIIFDKEFAEQYQTEPVK